MVFNCVSKKLRQLYIPSSIVKLQRAQDTLLSKFVKSRFDSRVVVLDSGEFINMIEMKSTSRKRDAGERERTIVLTHGYGSGLGFYWANYDHLVQQYDRVIAVDWLGMGGSSRPHRSKSPWISPCPSKQAGLSPGRGVDFFIDTLEELRKKEDITDFVLAGHSLGGYLSARYALKYAADAHVCGLVLISPVGVSSQPLPESTIRHSDLSFGLKAISTAWKWNLTPQTLVRAMGPRGRDMVTNVLLRRFGKTRWGVEEVKLIAEYLYHISVAEGSGEYALNALLQPIASTSGVGVYARDPLTASLGALKVPTLLQFGDHDWLYPKELPSYLKNWKSFGASIDVDVISRAGHHIYLDNPGGFHESVDRWSESRLWASTRYP